MTAGAIFYSGECKVQGVKFKGEENSNDIRGNGQTKKADQYTQMCECVNETGSKAAVQ